MRLLFFPESVVKNIILQDERNITTFAKSTYIIGYDFFNSKKLSISELIMRRINPPFPNESAILETSVPRKLPPYPLGVTMGAPGVSEMQPPYPNSSINLPYPMPEPSTMEPESENVTESIQRIQASLQLFDLSKSTEIKSPKEAGFSPSHPPTPSASYISKFLSLDCQNIMSELANIKYELSQEMTNKRNTMLREALKKVSQKIRSEMSNMTPEETEMIVNELLSVKSAYLDAIEKNGENHSFNNKNETKEPVPLETRSNTCITKAKETKIYGINMPLMFKLMQMVRVDLDKPKKLTIISQFNHNLCFVFLRF